MADLRRTGLAVALLVVGCGQNTSSGGGGGSDTPGPVVLPSGFFQNGASMVTISITESSSLDGLQVRVSPSGIAYITQPNTGTVHSGLLPGDVTNRFFADLVAAQPLDQHLSGTCDMGTVWGATPIQVSLGGPLSPNLLCPGDARMRALHDDVLTVLEDLNVRPMPMTPAPPSTSPAPAASATASAGLASVASGTPRASGTADASATATASKTATMANGVYIGPITGLRSPGASGTVPGVMQGEGKGLTPFLSVSPGPSASPFKPF